MLRLRQIALVATDLASAEDEVTAALGVRRCFRDPGVGVFGLHNALFPVGDQFLEIVSPTQEGTTAGRQLVKRGGDGGYMVLVQTDDLVGCRRRFADLGIRVVYEAVDEGILGLHLHPKDIGGAVVSIDQTDDPAEWTWAGPEWRDHQDRSVVTGFAAVEIQAEDPDAMAARWSAVLDRPVRSNDGGRVIELDDAAVRFVPVIDGRGEGVGGFDVRAADRALAGTAVDVVGTRVHFV
ncbi:MAG: VOC family protein [Actinomycetota bacterium]|nr:VOC family protein [Actinomycetota bacterium]